LKDLIIKEGHSKIVEIKSSYPSPRVKQPTMVANKYTTSLELNFLNKYKVIR